MSISNTISKNKNKLDYDYHLYRYSGEYTPLFYDIELFKKDNSSKYGEIQLIFNTSITDTYEAIFTRNGIVDKINYTINSSTQDDIYQQIIKIITDYYSDINFIFQIYEIGNSNIWNTMDKNYSVLSIKWNMSYGDLGFDIYALRPKLSFNVEDNSTNLLFTLNANSGHPPYEFSFAYSTTDDNPSSQVFSSDLTHIISKNDLNGCSYVSLTILVKDSYGALSEGGEYTINYGDSKVEIDKSTFQYKLIPNSV